MSQQNLEEEAGCGQEDCRKMKKQAMAKRTAVKETGKGQTTGLQKNCKNFLEILVLLVLVLYIFRRTAVTHRAHKAISRR
jgi:hypothetical protein